MSGVVLALFLMIILPLACLVLAHAAVRAIERFPVRHAFRGLAVAVIVWGMYLYPLATHKTVPVVLYTPILSLGNIVRPF